MASVVSKLSQAARSATAPGRIARRLPCRDLAGYTTSTAWTRPLLACAAAGGPLGPRFLRRGIATVPAGEDFARLPSGLPVGAAPKNGEEDYSGPYSPDDLATVFAFDEKDLASEETLWDLYGRWCSFYDVTRDHDEMVRRFGNFKEKARHVHEFNKSGRSYTKGLNHLSDLTWEEKRHPRRKPRRHFMEVITKAMMGNHGGKASSV